MHGCEKVGVNLKNRGRDQYDAVFRITHDEPVNGRSTEEAFKIREATAKRGSEWHRKRSTRP